MKATSGMVCAECGMALRPADEFHPYAACLMYRGCHNSKIVRDNLSILREMLSPTKDKGGSE